MSVDPADGPGGDRQEIASLLRYASHSVTARALVAVLLALVVLEVAWSGFRESFSREYPLIVGIFLSLVFVALGAVVVDVYFGKREEQRAKRERDRELETWDPIARRIFGELRAPLPKLVDALFDAQMGLWRAEAEKVEPDGERFARSIEAALRPVRDIIKEQFPTMALRPELRDAARHAEEACTAAEVAAQIARRWNSDDPSDRRGCHSALREAFEFASERQRWFQPWKAATPGAGAAEGRPSTTS